MPNILSRVSRGQAEMVAAFVRADFAQANAVHTRRQLREVVAHLEASLPKGPTCLRTRRTAWPPTHSSHGTIGARFGPPTRSNASIGRPGGAPTSAARFSPNNTTNGKHQTPLAHHQQHRRLRPESRAGHCAQSRGHLTQNPLSRTSPNSTTRRHAVLPAIYSDWATAHVLGVAVATESWLNPIHLWLGPHRHQLRESTKTMTTPRTSTSATDPHQ